MASEYGLIKLRQLKGEDRGVHWSCSEGVSKDSAVMKANSHGIERSHAISVPLEEDEEVEHCERQKKSHNASRIPANIYAKEMSHRKRGKNKRTEWDVGVVSLGPRLYGYSVEPDVRKNGRVWQGFAIDLGGIEDAVSG
ncbi:hypothetical protein CAPTEDRAFT_215932 [Capitella teleta]|uniref:Uncharacterized protein n=1 Tax=Capitella teleta TaxID=283909 RepID=R7VDD1_CAPTE|nr:hypothetical protein CAPTEDRAFT_215932 [Capitella teleta]|eukprot:ELU14311.1 hypothetical protein CAPTEDRAFT_215932 [Capitella teleta]